MSESRQQRLRRLDRLRGAARRWLVLGAGLTGATAVLVPYAGLGLPDAAWAAGAGLSLAMAVLRRRDHRALAAEPLPPERPRLAPAEAARTAMRAALSANPAARAAVDELSRRATLRRFRGSAALPARERLDSAALILTELRGPLSSAVGEALTEAAAGEAALRDLTERVLLVERAQRSAATDTRDALQTSRAMLLERLDDGVSTFERLVAAAASCVAEDGLATDATAGARLTDAADRMAAFAAGLGELRDHRAPAG